MDGTLFARVLDSFFSALCFCSELTTSILLTEIGILVLSCLPRHLSTLEVMTGGGAEDLKLGSFVIRASFLIKAAKTENGGNYTKGSCLYLVPCDIHFSCRLNGNLSTMGRISHAVSRNSSPGM